MKMVTSFNMKVINNLKVVVWLGTLVMQICIPNVCENGVPPSLNDCALLLFSGLASGFLLTLGLGFLSLFS